MKFISVVQHHYKATFSDLLMIVGITDSQCEHAYNFIELLPVVTRLRPVAIYLSCIHSKYKYWGICSFVHIYQKTQGSEPMNIFIQCRYMSNAGTAATFEIYWDTYCTKVQYWIKGIRPDSLLLHFFDSKKSQMKDEATNMKYVQCILSTLD